MKDKKSSKRQTLKKKYAVEKIVKEHKKKVRKLKNKTPLHHKSQKDPGIPNNWPFKKEMLKEIQQKKEREAQERRANKLKAKERARQQHLENMTGTCMDDDGEECPALEDASEYAEIASRAAQAASAFTDSMLVDDGSKSSRFVNTSTAGFVKDLRRVIEKADVLIEVLDARDPNACRNVQVEREIIAEGKKLILLLNKIDLVPRKVTEKWLNHLRISYPTEAFKAATSKSSRPIVYSKSSFNAVDEDDMQSSCLAIGAPVLLNLLKNYSRTNSSTSSKASILVGVIGIPNVGKSSVINSLCRNSNAAKVGGEAGITRALQEIVLDGKVKLIDSPGVIMGSSETDADVILRNSVKVSNIKDPIEVVDTLVNKYPKDQLMQLFKVPFFTSTAEFLGYLAKTRGKLCKGGSYDFAAAAQTVINDWTSGKIRHFCLPPEQNLDDEQAITDGLISGPRIVSKFSEPFEID